jgi:hypothetical protein
MNTSELTGAALDWAVAECEGWLEEAIDQWDGREFIETVHSYGHCNYSTEWAQGGPIIEREKICIEGRPGSLEGWAAHYSKLRESLYFYSIGATPLEAAMRCYVASKLGDDIDVPEELTYLP